MRGLFTQETVLVGQVLDLVQWQLGDRKVRIYYQTAFPMFSQIRVFAKAAVDLAGGNTRLWRELAKYENAEPNVPLHPTYRRSECLSNLKTIPRVDIEGELVVVYLDDLVAKFHCVDALKVQAAGMQAARDARRWAGDGSRDLVLTARLHNATPEGPLKHAGSGTRFKSDSRRSA